MDNQTTLQTYNSQLEGNNTDLITILNTINDLPETIVENWILTMEVGSTVTKEVVVE